MNNTLGVTTVRTEGPFPATVFMDGVPLDPRKSLAVINHSPDGFAWGYGGSGPAQLALAILLKGGIPEGDAVAYHATFKDEFIAGLPQDKAWEFGVDIPVWLGVKKAERGDV